MTPSGPPRCNWLEYDLIFDSCQGSAQFAIMNSEIGQFASVSLPVSITAPVILNAQTKQ